MADNARLTHGNFVKVKYWISDEWELFTWHIGWQTLRVKTDDGCLVLTDSTGRFPPIPGEPAVMFELIGGHLNWVSVVEYDGRFATMPGAWAVVEHEEPGRGHVEFRGRFLEEPEDGQIGQYWKLRYYHGDRHGEDDN